MSNYEHFEEEIPDECFIDSVVEKGLPLDIAQLMHSEMQETKEEEHNVIFIGTDGDKAIKAIHVPAASLNGKDGPVLFAGADEDLVIAAFSREYIDSNAQRISDEDTGLHKELWIAFMQDLHQMVEEEYTSNPPTWEEVL